MLRRLTSAVLICFATGLAACSTDATLSYTPPPGIATASAPAISAVSAVDQRKEAPNRLATVMGGFGNPLKILNTSRPVKDEVASAFADGLKARGMLWADGMAPFQIQLVIRKFDADMIMGSTARIDLDMIVTDRTNGQVIYRDSAIDQKSDFHFFATGAFASIEELQRLAQDVLDRSVDRMLDKAEFRGAIARGVRITSGPASTS